jgi:hypothetical protein
MFQLQRHPGALSTCKRRGAQSFYPPDFEPFEQSRMAAAPRCGPRGIPGPAFRPPHSANTSPKRPTGASTADQGVRPTLPAPRYHSLCSRRR